MWAQRNNHFTWPVVSCGNGHCFMPVTNMCYQKWASARYLSWLICNTWSVTGALPVTKGHLCPLPKWVFHLVNLSLTYVAFSFFWKSAHFFLFKSNSNSLENQLGIHLILTKQEKLASNSLAYQLGKNRNLAKLTSPHAYMHAQIVVAIDVSL
jgi:hypothetical protein